MERNLRHIKNIESHNSLGWMPTWNNQTSDFIDGYNVFNGCKKCKETFFSNNRTLRESRKKMLFNFNYDCPYNVGK
jgi:prolyl oligopeptidase PreP (S9A serine peptidase family)